MDALDSGPDFAELAEAFRAPDFMRDAACVESDAEFFPERGQSAAAAKAVCAGCLVRSECLEYALANRIEFGVWGAASPRERNVLHPKSPLLPKERVRARRGDSALTVEQARRSA
jgi:WhiB family redox-sensing transcriptional regulator